MSFLVIDLLVVWLYPDGSGLYCNDCFRAYRTYYKDRQSLTLHTQWLKNVDNFAEWTRVLIAFSTLLREDHTRITKANIRERMSTLDFFLKLVRVPSHRFEVKLLADLMLQ